jgi:hypothetical protein
VKLVDRRLFIDAARFARLRVAHRGCHRVCRVSPSSRRNTTSSLDRAGRRQRIIAIDAVQHADHDVGVVAEREQFEDLDASRPVRLRDPQADDDGVALVDEVERLEPTSLFIEVCKAADDLPTGASGRRLVDFGAVDRPPHHSRIQEGDPRRQLAAAQRVIRVPNHRVASSHHAGILLGAGGYSRLRGGSIGPNLAALPPAAP